MALAHNPRIVTDGLNLCLDAANPKSYPGSGTAWSDLSKNGNDGTLLNGVGYSANNKGQFTFDGGNDYVELGLPTNLVGVQVPLTINMLANLTSNSGNRTLWGVYKSVSGGGLYSLLRVDSGTLRYYASTSSGGFQYVNSFTIPLNQWFFYGAVVSGTLASPSVKIFLNDQSQSFSLAAMTSSPDTSVKFRIGTRSTSSLSEFWSGSISYASWYNRALSDTEILQNYNALKGRYGL